MNTGPARKRREKRECAPKNLWHQQEGGRISQLQVRACEALVDVLHANLDS